MYFPIALQISKNYKNKIKKVHDLTSLRDLDKEAKAY